MNKIWPMIQYYYCSQATIKYGAIVGVILLFLKIPAYYINDTLTFFLGLFSLTFIFLIPFCAGTTALRALISNSHLALIPGFHLRAGIALILIGIATSVYLYINWLIFSGEPVSPLVLLRTFTCLTLFAGLMQLILPSRFFVPVISLAPIVIVILILQNREIATLLFMETGYTFAFFFISLLGWAYGLHRLNSLDKFKPLSPAVTNTEAWSTYDGGFLTQKAIGKERSATGTLLLGYPDSWSGIIFRVVYFYLITPLLSSGGMFLIGIGEKWDKPMMETLVSIFLLISLFSAVYCIYIYGELIARARLVWLRFGKDRKQQWQLVEKHCLEYLFIYYCCALFITVTALLLTNLQSILLWHYLLLTVSFCFFNLYFSLMLKAKYLPILYLYLTVILSTVCVFAGISFALNDNNPIFIPLIFVETGFVICGLIFRALAKNAFLDIDWCLVSIKKTHRVALSQN